MNVGVRVIVSKSLGFLSSTLKYFATKLFLKRSVLRIPRTLVWDKTPGNGNALLSDTLDVISVIKALHFIFTKGLKQNQLGTHCTKQLNLNN